MQITPDHPTHHRSRSRLMIFSLALLKYLLLGIALFVGLLFVGHMAIENAETFMSLRGWLYHHRWYLLAWRSFLYGTTYAGIAWLWRQQVRRGEKIPPGAYRVVVGLTLLLLLCEYNIWSRSMP